MATLLTDLGRQLGVISGGNGIYGLLFSAVVIPLLMASSEKVWQFFRAVFDRLAKFLIVLVKRHITSWFTGHEVAHANIHSSNFIYPTILHGLLHTYKKNEARQSYLTVLTSMVTNSEMWEHSYSYMLNTTPYFRVEVDYSGKNAVRFNNSMDANSMRFYRFKYQGYSIRCNIINREYTTYMEPNKPTKEKEAFIQIEVISYSSVKPSNADEILSNFLRDTFDLQGKIPYVYTIRLEKSYNAMMQRYLYNYRDSVSGLLEYTDESVDEISLLVSHIKQDDGNDEYLPSSVYVAAQHNNSMTDRVNVLISDDDRVQDNGTVKKINFATLFNYYLSKDYRDTHRYSGYSYMYRDGRVVLIYNMSNSDETITWHMVIISIGKVVTIDALRNLIVEIGTATSSIKEKSEKKEVNVYNLVNGNWQSYKMEKRDMTTVYLPSTVRNAVCDTFNDFRSQEELYSMCGVPYRKCLLFYGPPGCGKTSLVKSLCYEQQISIYTVNVNDEYINDDTIITVLNQLGASGLKVLLFEDIDTAFADKEKMAHETKVSIEKHTSEKTTSEKVNRKFLTYTGLLNALDGVLSNQRGVVTVMTTNYPEKLGAAFVREGRIDMKFEIRRANHEQIEQMLTKLVEVRRKFYDPTNIDKPLSPDMLARIKEFARRIPEYKLAPCTLQQFFLERIKFLDKMFDHEALIAMIKPD